MYALPMGHDLSFCFSHLLMPLPDPPVTLDHLLYTAKLLNTMKGAMTRVLLWLDPILYQEQMAFPLDGRISIVKADLSHHSLYWKFAGNTYITCHLLEFTRCGSL